MPEEETTIDTIRDLRRQEPFVRFQIVMTSGEKYLIEDPDALAITSSQLHYFPRGSGVAVHMRLNQVASVEVEGEKPRAKRRRAS